MSTSYLQCSNCKNTMSLQRSKKRNIVIDKCNKCGGIYLDAGELELFIKDKEKLRQIRTNGIMPVGKGIKICPCCLDQPMDIGSLPGFSSQVDFCQNCKGIFLDKGELNEIVMPQETKEKKPAPINLPIASSNRVSSNQVELPKIFHDVISDNEEILWVGGPSLLSVTFQTILIFIGFSAFGVYSYVMMESELSYAFMWVIIGLLFALVSFVVTVFNRWYVMTNEKLIISSGILGTDFQSISYNKITDLKVSVTLIDKIFSTGTIYPYTASLQGGHEGREAGICHIDSPYKVFGRLKTLIDPL